MAKELSINPDAIVDNLATRCGDTGVPQPLLMMSYALETAKPGDKLLLVGFGGGCDVLLFEATEALQGYKSRTPVSQTLAAQRLPTNYLKLLSFHGEISLDWGMRSEVDEKTSLSQQYRAREQLYGFIGGHCVQCGVVQFPVLGSCVNCGSFVPMLPHRLADEAATLASYTFDNLQYYPDPPLHFGFAHFTSGARVLMELVDVDSGTLSVGSALRMVYRIKNIDSKRHYKRYFWKATRAL